MSDQRLGSNLTTQWWDEARDGYEVFVFELVIVEASAGDPEAASRRLAALEGTPTELLPEDMTDV